MAFEVLCEDALAERNRIFRTHGLEARALESLLLEFDEERAAIRPIAIVMRAEHAELCLAKRQRQRVERFGRAIPDEAVRPPVDGRPKFLLVLLPDPREGPVRRDDEIGGPQRFKRVLLRLEFDFDAELLDIGVEKVQQFETADRSEAVAGDRNMRVIMHDCDLRPALEMRLESSNEIGIVDAQEFERAVRKDDAEAPCRIALRAFVDRDLVARIMPLHQRGELQAGRARADDLDAHRFLLLRRSARRFISCIIIHYYWVAQWPHAAATKASPQIFRSQLRKKRARRKNSRGRSART